MFVLQDNSTHRPMELFEVMIKRALVKIQSPKYWKCSMFDPRRNLEQFSNKDV